MSRPDVKVPYAYGVISDQQSVLRLGQTIVHSKSFKSLEAVLVFIFSPSTGIKINERITQPQKLLALTAVLLLMSEKVSLLRRTNVSQAHKRDKEHAAHRTSLCLVNSNDLKKWCTIVQLKR